MDGWERAYRNLRLGKLDQSPVRFLLYAATLAFWVQFSAWLLLRTELIPSVDDAMGWLVLSLLALPGNVRAIFLVALGPNPSIAQEHEAKEELPRWRRRIQFRLREQWRRTGRSSGEEPSPNAPSHQSNWGDPHSGPHPYRPAPSTAMPAGRNGSAVGTLVKVLVGITLFAVCGGYWLTGGTIVDPSDNTTEPPRLRNQAEKRHMLELINQARTRNGVPPVSMGSNNVAQIQADQMLEECVFSHWGTDGLKPYMRYSLAGGYQNNGENALTSNECSLTGTWLQWNDDLEKMVRDAVESLLESPGHRETMLDPSYSRVNIGLAWDRNTFKAVQHFEGDFVEYDTLPAIEEGRLELEGSLKNRHRFSGDLPLIPVIIFDPPPERFTRAQLARTHCYGHGELAALLVPPERLWKDEYQITKTFEAPGCIDPYTVSEHAQDPLTVTDMAETWEEARRNSDRMRETKMTLRFRRAEQVTAEDDFFSVTADVEELLDEYGPGVYTVALLANLEDSPVDDEQVISEYSVFHQVTPPTTYSGNQ